MVLDADTMIGLAQADGAALAEPFSQAMVQLIERAQPGVVQVRGQQRGMGAGVVWDERGHIVTNHHVVAAMEMKDIKVLLTDGRELVASVIGSNSSLDLALLKVNPEGLVALPVAASSNLRVGELVFAIGHPWGRRGVATAGIVSGLGEARVAGNWGRLAQYIRSDVRLAPGNSGGPLLNSRGEVIGINAMIFGGDLSVAIAGQVVRDWVAGLLGQRRTFLGAGVQKVKLRTGPDWVGPPLQTEALRVASLEPAGPAGLAGLKQGDVVLEVDGEHVRAVDTLSYILTKNSPGNILSLKVLRGSQLQTFELKLGGLEQAE